MDQVHSQFTPYPFCTNMYVEHKFSVRAYDQWDRYRCEADESKRRLMLRIPALDDDLCKMTPFCGESRLFGAYLRGRPGWRDISKVEDIPHQWWRRRMERAK